MADRICANLPSRDFDATEAFYARLGFSTRFRNPAWMILARGPLELEFFPHPGLAPIENWFSASLRFEDIEALLAEWRSLGLPSDAKAIPRLTGFFTPSDGPKMFALVDPDGSLLRCMGTRD